MADFFATADAIQAEIEARIPAVKKVYQAKDLEGVTNASQVSPAVHVLFSGYTPAQSERIRQDITLDQTGSVVLVVRHARGKQEQEGGAILDELVRVLHGFKPSEALLALELAPAAFSPTYRPGVAYFPLAFTTRVVNRKGA